MRRSTFLLFGILVGACNSDTFSGEDGGTDAQPDVPGVSGGDGSTDAPFEGSVKDSGPKPRFCQFIDAQFCADFDVPNDAGAGFGPAFTTNGFTLDFQQGTVKSQPLALRSTEPGDSGGAAYLGTALGVTGDAGASSMVTLDLDIYLPQLTVSSSQALFAFAIGVGSPNFQFGLATEGKNVWKLENFQTSVGPQLAGSVAPNEWAHANLQILLSSTSGTVTLTVTSSAGTATTVMPTITAPGPGNIPVLLNVGAQSNGASVQPGTFFYDNIVVRYQ